MWMNQETPVGFDDVHEAATGLGIDLLPFLPARGRHALSGGQLDKIVQQGHPIGRPGRPSETAVVVRDDKRPPRKGSPEPTQPGHHAAAAVGKHLVDNLAGRHRLHLRPEGAQRRRGQRSIVLHETHALAGVRRQDVAARDPAHRRIGLDAPAEEVGISARKLDEQARRAAADVEKVVQPQLLDQPRHRSERRRTAILERLGMAFPVDGSRRSGGIAGQVRQLPRRVAKGAEIQVEKKARRAGILGRRREVPLALPHQIRADRDIVEHSAKHRRIQSKFPRQLPGGNRPGQIGEDAEVMKRADGMGQMERFGQVVGGQALGHGRHRGNGCDALRRTRTGLRHSAR